MSKKILSFALAVVMLMSMFAFTTSAADLAEGCQIGLRVESNAYVGMPAGETVQFKVYYVLPEETDLSTYRQASGNFAIGFTSAYKFDTTNVSNANTCRTWGASYDFFGTGAVSISSSVQSQLLAKADTSYGWDNACQVVETYLSGAAYKAATGFPVDPDCEIFTLEFKTTKTLEVTDTIGIIEGAYDTNFFKLAYWASNLSTSNKYAKDVVDFSNIIATPTDASATPSVTHEKTMGQMKSWSTLTGPFNGGLVGKISDLALTFDSENQCNEIKKIEVAVTTDAGTTTSEAYQVYEQADGSYLFRAVIKNMDTTDTKTFSCKYIVTLADGTTTYSSADVTGLSANGIYTAALANYNASK